MENKLISGRLFFVTVLVSFVMLSAAVLAVPGQPHRFWGDVTINGAPAPDGTVVSARIDGVDVASETTLGGKYGYDGAPIFNVDDPDGNRVGKIITFFVNGVNTGSTATFRNAGHDQLDLAITTSSPPSGGGGGGGSGGGGGGGGGGGSSSTGGSSPTGTVNGSTSSTTTGGAVCVEQWVCTDWSACAGSTQTRTCTDANNCGTTDNKPNEVQPCTTVTEEPEQSAQPSYDFLTAFATAGPTGYGIVVIVVLILLGIGWYLLKGRKKSKQ